MTVSTNTIQTKLDFAVTGTQKAAAAFQGFIDKNRTLGALFNNTVESLKAINPAAGLAAAGIAAMGTAAVTATKQAIDLADSLLVVSQRTGITVESLSALKFAAERSNASFGDVQAGLRFLARNADAAAHGSDRAAAAFKRIGVNIRDAGGNLKTADQLFSDVAEGISKLPSPMEKAAVSAQLLGRLSGPALVPLLEQGRAGIEKLEKQARDLGLVISTDFARKSNEFKDNVAVLHQVAIGFGQAIGDAALPAINEFLKVLIADAPKALENFKVGLLTANFLLQKFTALSLIAAEAANLPKKFGEAVAGDNAQLDAAKERIAFYTKQLKQTQEEFLDAAAAAEKHTEATKKNSETALDAKTSLSLLVDEITAMDKATSPVVNLAKQLGGDLPGLADKFQALVSGLQGIKGTGPEAAKALDEVRKVALQAQEDLGGELAAAFKAATTPGEGRLGELQAGREARERAAGGGRTVAEERARQLDQFGQVGPKDAQEAAATSQKLEESQRVRLDLSGKIQAAIEAQNEAYDKQNDTIAEGQGILQGLTDLSFGFADALLEAASGAKDAFADFFKQLLKDLLRAIIRATILTAILSIFGGGFSLAKIGASIQKQLGFGGFQDRESSILGRAAQANTFSALAGATPVMPAVAAGPSTVGVVIEEPGPFTKATVTDKWVIPRLRQRQRQMNEQGF